jgi:5'-phosphate synthase pdxT subunit
VLVGVLALQGDFADHHEALERLGVQVKRVRAPEDLVGLHGLVLPGGESTTMLRLLRVTGLLTALPPLIERVPVLATCAGMILLASKVTHPDQESLGLLDVSVARNGYGRQIHSGVFPLQGPGVPPGTSGVFIRAPRVLAVGPSVEVLAYRDEDPVLVQQGHILAAGFHPELEREHPVVGRFVGMLRRCASSSSSRSAHEE